MDIEESLRHVHDTLATLSDEALAGLERQLESELRVVRTVQVLRKIVAVRRAGDGTIAGTLPAEVETVVDLDRRLRTEEAPRRDQSRETLTERAERVAECREQLIAYFTAYGDQPKAIVIHHFADRGFSRQCVAAVLNRNRSIFRREPDNTFGRWGLVATEASR